MNMRALIRSGHSVYSAAIWQCSHALFHLRSLGNARRSRVSLSSDGRSSVSLSVSDMSFLIVETRVQFACRVLAGVRRMRYRMKIIRHNIWTRTSLARDAVGHQKFPFSCGMCRDSQTHEHERLRMDEPRTLCTVKKSKLKHE